MNNPQGDIINPTYQTPTHVNVRSAALHSDGARIVMALDALVNAVRDQTAAIHAQTSAIVHKGK